MKIHKDEVVINSTPRKAVSFGDAERIRHSGRTPLRESNGRTPMKSSHPYNASKSNMTPFKSHLPTKMGINSNSFRQDLKKECSPAPTKTMRRKTTNTAESIKRNPRQQHSSNQRFLPKTPSSASALRRTIRSTIRTQEKQQHSSSNSQLNPVAPKISLRATSDNEPFQSITTAMSSYNATSSLAGRTRLLGKGGLAPGKSLMTGLGPPTRVAPKTPNTLLRTELEDEDEFDESMLLSPPPGALWNALNLSSVGGDKRHTMSPTVTTGLIVISPQAAEQIHTWSSTEKKISVINSSPKATDDKISPTVPRALSQTLHTVATRSHPMPSNDHIQKSTLRNQKIEDGFCAKNAKTATSVHLVKDRTPLVSTDIESSTDSYMEEGTFKAQGESIHQGSVKKSTKGGVAMDMTDFFTLENNKPEKKIQKKWVESKPLSSSMPAALLSRLNANRGASSTKTRSKGMKFTQTVTKGSSSSTLIPKNSDSFRKRPNDTTSLKSVKTDSTASNGAMKLLMRTTGENRSAIDTEKTFKRRCTTNSLHPENKTSIDINIQSKKRHTVAPLKRELGKSISVVKNIESNVTNKNAVTKDTVESRVNQVRKRVNTSKEVNKFELSSTEPSSARQDHSNVTDSIHRGGLAFDVNFKDDASITIRSQTARERTKVAKVSSAIVKTKESRDACGWSTKQCDVFVGWLNYTLNPEEMDMNSEGCVASGLRALIIHRRLAEGRVNAMNLFKEKSMQQIRTIIVKEIARGRLSIRADRDVSVDVQLRKKLTSLLLSYTTPWLRVALEIMSGECIEPVPISESSPKTYLSRMKLSLENFIRRRFLSDDNILQKFTKGRCNVPSGAFEKRYKEEMRRLVLSRIMTLVFFLDRAKASNVLENVPRLFTISSNVKSTRDVLITICRECLSSEGDIVKHFSRIGLKVSYVQDPVDEVNFRVNNLATDLRDGVILTRLSEIVTNKRFKSCMSNLRLPAVSRLQKKFNVNLAISVLKDFGITLAEGINAHHVMDGHREKVLALMWCVIAHCCLEKLLQGNQVEQEIQNVIQSSVARKKIEGRFLQEIDHSALNHAGTSASAMNSPADKTLRGLLLRWSQAVCSSFGVVINNLSDSFADGKVLCLLVHYYHPSLINIDEILAGNQKPRGDQTGLTLDSKEALSGKERLNWKKASKSMQELGGIPDMLPICDSKNPPNEKSMILCLSYLCSRLMESSREIFATILIQACYRKYCTKKMIVKKNQAAETIFRIWTIYKDNYFRQQEQRFKIAVTTIENFVLSHKQSLEQLKKARLKKEYLVFAVTIIQRVFRGRQGRVRFHQLLRQNQAAIVIQSVLRRYLAIGLSKSLSQRRNSTIVIQSAFRRFIAREMYLDYCYYIIEIQRIFRGYVARKDLEDKNYAVRVIQEAWWAHVENVERDFAAIYIQKIWRGNFGRRQRVELAIQRDAAMSIQKIWRGYSQSTEFFVAIESSIFIQRMIRGFLARKAISVNRYRLAATSIQKVWRGFSAQVQYQIDFLDIVCVQSLVRRFLSRIAYQKRVNGLTILQCACRCWIARRQLSVKMKQKMEERLHFRSAVKIQSHARTLITRQKFYAYQHAANLIQGKWRKLMQHRLTSSASTKIQSMFRSRKCRYVFSRSKRAAITVQRFWRGFAIRRSNQMLSFAATLIQCTWRRYWAYSDYVMYINEVESATLIQAHVRRFVTLKMLSKLNYFARTIQLCWLKCKELELESKSATKIQAIFRSHFRRSRFLEMRSASIVVQKIARSRRARNILHAKQKKRQYDQAVITVQRIWRGFSKQVQFQMDIMDIICVQSIARRYLVSGEYKISLSAICTIQRAFRCAAARRERALRKLVFDTLVAESSIKIQTAVRGLITRSKYVRIKNAFINTQKHWRGFCVRKNLCHTIENATAIQKTWRMYLLHKKYILLVNSATKIQTYFRLYSAQAKYLAMAKAAACIQRRLRGNIVRDSVWKQHQASIVIQSYWRRSFAQNNYLLDLLEIKSATLIQASFRMYMHRMDYMVVKYSAHTIQRFTRGLLSRVDLAVKHFAATEIQRIWRGSCTFSLESMLLCIVKIQSVVRMSVAKKKVNVLWLSHWAEIRSRNRNASIIQTSFRKYVLRKQRENAAKTIQRTFRHFAQLKRNKAASRGVIELQSRFRGAQVRNKRGKRLRQLAYRIQEETRRAILNPTMRLGYRTSRALEILQTSQSLTKIMDAVKELEASTRLSVICCQVFTKVNAADILLHLIQSCNRSVPHMELKEHILLTLENVARCPSLVGSFAHCKYAEVFLDNVQVFRDKDGIFCLAVLLLDRITKAEKSLAQFCATHEHLKRLKEVYRVVSRRRIRSQKSKVLSEKTRRLRKYGLAKRDDFDRETSTRMLREMIESFSTIEISRNATPAHTNVFKFD